MFLVMENRYRELHRYIADPFVFGSLPKNSKGKIDARRLHISFHESSATDKLNGILRWKLSIVFQSLKNKIKTADSLGNIMWNFG